MNNKKIESLQGLRAIAFLFVFCSHVGILNYGQLGVSIFFVLSGFLTFYKYQSKELVCKIKSNVKSSFNKILKLYPLHIVMMILDIIILIPDVFDNLCDNIIKVLLNITLLQSLVPNFSYVFSYNGVAWFLSTSMFIYILLPYVIKFIKKITSTKKILLLALSILIIQFVSGYTIVRIPVPEPIAGLSKWFTYIFPIYRLGDVTLGCCLSWMFVNKHSIFEIGKITSTIIMLFTVVYISFSHFVFNGQISILRFFSNDWFKSTLLQIIPAILLVYLFTINNNFITKILTTKPFIFLGNISGYTYLIHLVLLQYVGKFFEIVCPTIQEQPYYICVEAVVGIVLTILLSLLWKNITTKKQSKKVK